MSDGIDHAATMKARERLLDMEWTRRITTFVRETLKAEVRACRGCGTVVAFIPTNGGRIVVDIPNLHRHRDTCATHAAKAKLSNQGTLL